MRVLISAGEPSGDLHAGSLIRALRARDPHLVVDAVGGDRLREAGAEIIEDISSLGAMGLFEAASGLGHHVALLRRLEHRIRHHRYDVLVLVDYPGFHLRVARAAAGRVPVLYYVAPQLWAWGAWRARRLRETIDRLAVILPFEEPFFRGHDIVADFVGHPLVDHQRPSRSEARRILGIRDDAIVLGLFPGSRPGDRVRHQELFMEAARRVTQAVPDARVLLAAPGAGSTELSGVQRSALVHAAADAAIVKSGTATLEAALAGLPMVVAYRMHPVTFAVAKRLVRTRHVSLVNLVANRALVPELIQSAATPSELAGGVIPLLDPAGSAAHAQREGFQAIRRVLGAPGVADRVASLVIELAA